MLEDECIDHDFYAATYAFDLAGANPTDHYRREGFARGFLPAPGCDPDALSLLHTMGLAEPEDASIQQIHRKILGELLRHLLDHDGFFWLFLDTHVPGPTGRARPYEPDAFREPEREGEMLFPVAGRQCRIRQTANADFLAALDVGTPIAHLRLPHGFWDALCRVEVLCRIIADHVGGDVHDEAVFRLAIRLVGHIVPNAVVYLENFVPEVLAVARSLPHDVPIALAFKAFPDGGPGLFGSARGLPPRAPFVFDAVGRFAGERDLFDDAMLMKRLVMAGDFSAMMSRLKDRPVLVIANACLADFGERFGLRHARFLEIPPARSHEIRHELLQRCREVLRDLDGGGEPPVVLTRSGGSFAFWLLAQLRVEFPEATFLDLGQSVNLWFLDREGIVKAGGLPWTPGLGQQIEVNDLAAFYRDRLSIPDIKAFHIARHGEANPGTRWVQGSRFLHYARLLRRFGLVAEARLALDRARDEAPENEEIRKFASEIG